MALPKVLEQQLQRNLDRAKQADSLPDDGDELAEVDVEDESTTTLDPNDDSRIADFLVEEEEGDDDDDAPRSRGKPDLRVVQDDGGEEEEELVDTTLDTFFTRESDTKPEPNAEIAAMREEMKTLREELKAERKKPSKAESGNYALDLTPEQISTYKAALPVIEKVATAIVNRVIDQRMDSIVNQAINPVRDELSSQVNTLRSDLTTVSEKSFFTQVRSAVKDVDKLIRTKKFINATNGVEPNTGKTYGQLMADAHAARNVSAFVNVVELLRPEKKVAPKRRSKASTNSRTRPSTPGAKFTTSDKIRMINKLSRGQITQEQMNKFMVAFDAANKKGLVTDDLGQR
jgi:hypothetical protein